MELLELIGQSAFCVKDGKITAANRAALQRQISPERELKPMLCEYAEEYDAFEDGILYLRLQVDGTQYDATVTRTDEGDLFLLDDPYTDEALKSMTLCSMHLRSQLSGVMSSLEGQTDSALIRGIYKLQRTVCNMSDIAYYRSGKVQTDTLEIGSVIYEIVEKASVLLGKSGRTLRFTGLREQVFTQGNYELIERAVYNLISNAAKFTDSEITVTAAKKGSSVLLTVEDSGDGISEDLYSTLFNRYQRQPGIEDGRFGIGLGLSLVRAAAAVHGGTVLVTRGKSGGTKVTMSIAIRPSSKDTVRTPAVKLSDYAGGNDHALVELSDVLPVEVYSL